MANEFIIKNGFISKGDGQVEGNISVDGDTTLSGLILKKGVVSTTNNEQPNISNVSIWDITVNAGSPETTLPNGSDGQILTCYLSSATEVVTVTPTSSAPNYSSFTLTAVGQSVNLIYDNTIVAWIITGFNGATINV